MKKRTIGVSHDWGAYIHCFQRPGGLSLADVNFFDGERSLKDLREMRAALDKAIVEMTAWEVGLVIESKL